MKKLSTAPKQREPARASVPADPEMVEGAAPSTPPSAAGALALFAAATFLGAFLLFQVQPILGKYLLPRFGGSPAVWTVCMLFFQAGLLAGYGYAHLLSRYAAPRTQAIIHTVLLAAALAILPLSPSARLPYSGGPTDPTWQIFLLLTLTAGVPYVVLSATGPLTQSWFARATGGRSPYRLYALSNAGSLLALLSYPFVFEPLMTRRAQSLAWSGGLAVFALVCAACGWVAAARGRRVEGEDKAERRNEAGSGPSVGERLLWVAFAMVASVLLLATTNKLCQDVAVVPFLWVLPLAVYLLTFILAFDSPRWYVRPLFAVALPVSVAAVIWLLFKEERSLPLWAQVAVFVGALFACCMICHGELARRRPADARHLTGYYLLIAAGGAAGSLFTALAAPALFAGYLELHWGLFACCLLGLVVLYVDANSPLRRGRRGLAWAGVVAVVATLGMYLWAAGSQYLAGAVTLWRSRDFYGVLRVYQTDADDPARRALLLQHGGITHGLQLLQRGRRNLPTTYYAPTSGVGRALASFPKDVPRRVGAVGLGVGTVAAYGRKGDSFRFYELNPTVAELAHDPFTFLSRSAADVEVVLGDGRLSLEREPPNGFDLLVLDAFSGDAIPTHLLTGEAFELYRTHMRDDGAWVIAIHVSNHYLDLEPVAARLAEEMGWAAGVIDDTGDESTGRYISTWVLLSPDAGGLDGIVYSSEGGRPARRSDDVPLWTDEYTNLFRISK